MSCAPCISGYSSLTNSQITVVITSSTVSYNTLDALITLTFTITNNTALPLNSPIMITPTNRVAIISFTAANIPVGGSTTRTRYYHVTAEDLLQFGINFSATSYVIMAGRRALLSTTSLIIPRVP